jgi:hypothetical protein
MAAPDTAPPPSFPSHCARAVQVSGAVEQADVHARMRNWTVQRKLDPPNIVAAELPPDKPNLRFTPETIPQGKLTLLMQPQLLAEVHPFALTLRKWQQGIPVDCGLDWDSSVIEAAVYRGPHPTAWTPKSIAFFVEDIKYQIKAGFCWVFLWEELKCHLPANFKISLLDKSGLPDTAVDYEKTMEARKLLSASDLHGDRCHSERTTQITAVDYEKALEARKLLSASDLHGDRRHSERTMQMLTQQCRQRALLAMSA